MNEKELVLDQLFQTSRCGRDLPLCQNQKQDRVWKTPAAAIQFLARRELDLWFIRTGDSPLSNMIMSQSGLYTDFT